MLLAAGAYSSVSVLLLAGGAPNKPAVKPYILTLSKLLSDLPEKELAAKDRAVRIAIAKDLGRAAKQKLIAFLVREKSMGQVQRIGDPKILPLLPITCTEEFANRVR